MPEIERRWLVRLELAPSLATAPRRIVEDKYIDGGRLRLRAAYTEGMDTVFKLGKKYPRDGGTPEQVVSIYLSERECRVLHELPGVCARKVRYALLGGSLDVYEQPASAPAIFEVEFPTLDAASAYTAPDFVGEEVTRIGMYSGYAIASQRQA